MGTYLVTYICTDVDICRYIHTDRHTDTPTDIQTNRQKDRAGF
jgi:hypothetical protein